MTDSKHPKPRPLVLLLAGAKGAVASTVSAAAAALRESPEMVAPYLTTSEKLPAVAGERDISTAGWDCSDIDLIEAVRCHGVLSHALAEKFEARLSQVPIKPAPDSSRGLQGQVEQIMKDIDGFKKDSPGALFVLVNLLPAAFHESLDEVEDLETLYKMVDAKKFPDLGYVLGAVMSGVPVVNFTPNDVEIPVVCKKAEEFGVPVAGRDGKTGQTYLKVAMASALKARSLRVDGWYSLNILGNADGQNLMDPQRASGKLANKTKLLDEILGYHVGENYGVPTHKVLIDYYPPRGDAKEAWDVIDFNGLFGLPMSIRINFQCRDSILAAPLAIDMARWVAALKLAGRKGPVPELGFYFKKPVGDNPPVTFQEQLQALEKLERECGQVQ